MDTITHNGLVFVKASVLAKRHRYTTDYIGQLCRQNKVEAQLVGRAWYVNENSLLNHKIDHKKNTRSNEIISKNSTEMDVQQAEQGTRVAVHSVTSKKTFRQFFATELPAPINHHWQNRAVSYVDDAATLVPQVTNKIRQSLVEVPSEISKPAVVHVALAESQNLPVQIVSESNKHLTFTDLPEVTLSGDLPIENMDTESDFTDPEPVMESDFDTEPEAEPISEQKVRPGITLRYDRSVARNLAPAPAFKEHVATRTREHTTIIAKPATQSISGPTKMVALPTLATPVVATRARSRSVLLLPVAVLVAVAVATFLMAGSSTLRTDGSTARESFSFRFSTLTGALIFFSQKP